MTNHSLVAGIWLYKGDHRFIIHHQALGDKKPAFKWEELPRDVIASILSRLGPAEQLTRVQYVCRTWRDICWDPLMWRRIRFGDRFDEAYPYNYLRDRYAYLYPKDDDDDENDHIKWRAWHWRRRWFLGRKDVYSCLDRLCRLAVDRSLGGLESITLHRLASDDLLHYVAHRGMPRLIHLKLGGHLRNDELEAILDGCTRLESLDLYGCYDLDLKGKLGLRCSKQIKEFRGSYVATDDSYSMSYHSGDSEYYNLTPTEYSSSSDGDFADGDYSYQDNYDDYDDDINLN